MQCYTWLSDRNECYNVYCSKFSFLCHSRLILSASHKNLSSSCLSFSLSFFFNPTQPQWHAVWQPVKHKWGCHSSGSTLFHIPHHTHKLLDPFWGLWATAAKPNNYASRAVHSSPPTSSFSSNLGKSWEIQDGNKAETKLSDCFSHMPARTSLPHHLKFWNSHLAVIHCWLGTLLCKIIEQQGKAIFWDDKALTDLCFRTLHINFKRLLKP